MSKRQRSPRRIEEKYQEFSDDYRHPSLRKNPVSKFLDHPLYDPNLMSHVILPMVGRNRYWSGPRESLYGDIGGYYASHPRHILYSRLTELFDTMYDDPEAMDLDIDFDLLENIFEQVVEELANDAYTLYYTSDDDIREIVIRAVNTSLI